MDPVPVDYVRFLAEIKDRIRTAQVRAAVSLNREMLRLYWEIGRSIVERQEREGWGNAVIERLSRDLRREFPAMKGLSRTNLFDMRRWFLAYRDGTDNCPAVAGQLPMNFYLSALDDLVKHPEDRPLSGSSSARRRTRLPWSTRSGTPRSPSASRPGG